MTNSGRSALHAGHGRSSRGSKSRPTICIRLSSGHHRSPLWLLYHASRGSWPCARGRLLAPGAPDKRECGSQAGTGPRHRGWRGRPGWRPLTRPASPVSRPETPDTRARAAGPRAGHWSAFAQRIGASPPASHPCWASPVWRCKPRVAYPRVADTISGLLPYRLHRLSQPVMSPPHRFSTPLSTLVACI
jgi:hypothetical protein